MADVQRARGVRRHELDVDFGPAPDVPPAVPRSRLENRGEHRDDLFPGEKEIDEPGTGDLDFAHESRRQRQRRHELPGHVARLRFEGLGKREGQIGRDIAVRRVLGALEQHVGGGRAKLRRRLPQRRAEGLVSRHLSELEYFAFLSGFGLASGVFSAFSVFSPARL